MKTTASNKSSSAPQTEEDDVLELSIIMPCLNEAETLELCIIKARHFLEETGTKGEVVIADNGSTDGSQGIARRNGARVVDVSVRGYGAALQAGIVAARGRYIVMGDSDDSYDFSRLMPFLEKLHAGYELVMGNRFAGGIDKGAMPFLHKHLGNPVLSFIGRLFYRAPVNDFHCGLRAFNRKAIQGLDLVTTGMEFATEMVVKSALHNLKITEVPTSLAKDGRNRPPHLRTWRDGWRHLIFLLMYSPRWLFFIPGTVLAVCGALMMLAVLPGPVLLGRVAFDVHTLVVAAAMLISGTQIMIFAFLAKQYATVACILPKNPAFEKVLSTVTLERALIVGVLIVVAGLVWLTMTTIQWGNTSFGQLDYEKTMRHVVPSTTFIIFGLQTVCFGFFTNLLKLNAGRFSKTLKK